YLAHFRADSIVADAEWIRRELGVERWSVLGQSFGGFCAMRYLSAAPVGLPSGDRLHPARVRQLGEVLGMSDGYERLHYLLELDPDSPAFLHDAEEITTFARNPLYAILQEACWADGARTAWSAQRVLEEQKDWPEEYFTGEHVFPWMFGEASVEVFAEVAELLARRRWPALYDRERLR